jgi:hypothetical protein
VYLCEVVLEVLGEPPNVLDVALLHHAHIADVEGVVQRQLPCPTRPPLIRAKTQTCGQRDR